MFRRLWFVVVALAVIGVWIPGCGGNGSLDSIAAPPPAGPDAGSSAVAAEFDLRIDPETQTVEVVAADPGAEVSAAADVTRKVRPRIRDIRWYPCEKRVEFDVALGNRTRETTYYEPMKAVVRRLWPSCAEVLNADGRTEGQPHWDYSGLLGDGQLDPNELSEEKTWNISSPLWGIVLVKVRVLAELEPRLTSKIAFCSNRDGDWEIHVMAADGSDQINITNAPDSHDEMPRWSPDGSKIAFTTERDGDCEVYVMNADGSDPVNLSTHPGHNDTRPNWSPDGSMIVFQRHFADHSALFVMNADGTDQTQVTFSSWHDNYPCWGPSIIFGRDRSGPIGHWDLWAVDPDGSNERRLTDTPANDDIRPAWSPDGSKIAFLSTRESNYLREQVFVMEADGSNPTNITNSPYRQGWVSWSPDGTRLVFDRCPYNTWDIEVWVMNADGSGAEQLTDAPGRSGFPDWSPWLPGD